ncbi:MAG: aspartate--tRNA ligase [Micavibrio aeruginosavorus]|uniref:Aspartate--tRNA(Asp/Asn) ligase n=1 Tax=Micavibrio aeruginosavorus TaxID=349221 RepID=A0A7T5UH24_9BACT|nr:MAG: aspartate--tRNA ligase [Micavibrio aeruginosavorus]
MHAYRTHKCAELRKDQAGQTVKLSGWIHRKRDHGGVLFIDLRDTTGITQCVVDQDSPLLTEIEKCRVESVITITGRVKTRQEGTVNRDLATGEIEVYIDDLTIQSQADVLPLQVADADAAGEDVRLKYRFLDLRRDAMHNRIRLRNNIIRSMRQRMWDQGFQEFNTPILTASSPEGARDYLVPSRLHPGKFYALPQAPQQFKQLLMVSGFDRYFQIAPCFRDEDGRADRLAEFYQLDMEMSFVKQEDIFATMTPVIDGVFKEFADWTGTPHRVEWLPNMAYNDAILKYGSDKPDMRNPLAICDVTDVFKREDVTFNAFKGIIEKGGVVRAIRCPQVAGQPRSFFDKLNDWARGEGAPGLGYILFEGAEGKGPIAKFVPTAAQEELKKIAGLKDGDAIFFVCDMEGKAAKLAGRARDKICDDLPTGHACAREKGVYKFMWIVDFPMYEFDEKSGKIDFSHNPFSMPQGGLEALNGPDPLKVMATQYDCVCNGFELASGGIRNHKPEIMERAFAIAGYSRDVLEKKFGGMLDAFRFGAPPHGGCAFGIDRIVMILANEPNLREVYAFVMNGAYEDPMMGAPTDPTPQQLKDLHLKVVLPAKVESVEKKAQKSA